MPVTTEQVWVGFHSKLLGYIEARSRNPQDAEDILQEAFVKVHRRLDTLREDEQLVPWLYQVTHNTIIDFYRKKHPVPTTADVVGIIEDEDHTPVAEQRLALFLAVLVEGLPEIYRQAIVLIELHGMSQAELARRTGLSLSGAKSRVQRARAMLRQDLLNCCHIEVDCRGHIIDFESRSSIPWRSDCVCDDAPMRPSGDAR